jgi:hypothetical protein
LNAISLNNNDLIRSPLPQALPPQKTYSHHNNST